MGTIAAMKRRFEALDTNKVIEEVMQDSEGMMADLNAEQINQGIKADGEFMPDYSFRSVFQYGKRPGPITLRDKGDWQAGIFAKVIPGSGVIQFGSNDDKDDMLRDRYGEDISGLSEKYKLEVIRESVRPGLRQKMFDATGLLMKRT